MTGHPHDDLNPNEDREAHSPQVDEVIPYTDTRADHEQDAPPAHEQVYDPLFNLDAALLDHAMDVKADSADADAPVPATRVPEKRTATFEPLVPPPLAPTGPRAVTLPEHQLRPFLKAGTALLKAAGTADLVISARTPAHPSLTLFVVTQPVLRELLLEAQGRFNALAAGRVPAKENPPA